MHKLYLSGPMTGIKDKNKNAFQNGTMQLRAKGYKVINPWELDMAIPQPSWAECLRRDIVALMRCNGVATLPGWKKSRGANLEVYIAQSLGWPVHSVSYWRNK
jgi:hypothetical protein